MFAILGTWDAMFVSFFSSNLRHKFRKPPAISESEGQPDRTPETRQEWV